MTLTARTRSPSIRRRTLTASLLAAPLAGAMRSSFAQSDYPNKPVKVVVSGPPGAMFDVVTRVVCDSLSNELGQPFTVENRAGAGGFIGMGYAARAAADGYTLLGGGLGLNVLPPAIFTNAPLDPLKSFVPITYFGDMFNAMIVKADSPYKTFGDVLADAKKRPGMVSFGSNPPGSSPYMDYALLALQTGAKFNYIPYKGPNEVLGGIMSGTLDVGLSQLPAYTSMIKAGQIRALAVSSATRAEVVPDVPTMIEAGVADHVVSSWLGMFAISGTPQPIVEKLNAAMLKGLANPVMRSKLAATGFIPNSLDTLAFSQRIDKDFARWSDVAQKMGIVSDYSKQT